MPSSIIWNSIKPFIEIFILWIVFYRILVFFQGTRALYVLKGISYFILVFFIVQFLKLEILSWLLERFFGISILALLILFQQELRQGLARLGQQNLFAMDLAEAEAMAVIEEIVSSAYRLSSQQIGCLMAFERDIKLKTYIESGIPMDAKLSAELIQSIFSPQSPLHDGGVILHHERIVAASCLFPLSENPNLNKIIGTRHRAALGITEQTDSVVVMVSEETGEISVAADGKFIPVANRERLVNILRSLLIVKNNKKK